MCLRRAVTAKPVRTEAQDCLRDHRFPPRPQHGDAQVVAAHGEAPRGSRWTAPHRSIRCAMPRRFCRESCLDRRFRKAEHWCRAPSPEKPCGYRLSVLADDHAVPPVLRLVEHLIEVLPEVNGASFRDQGGYRLSVILIIMISRGKICYMHCLRPTGDRLRDFEVQGTVACKPTYSSTGTQLQNRFRSP